MRIIVAFEREIIDRKIEYILDGRIDPHTRQRSRLTGELQLHLLEVITIDMHVAACPDKLSWLETTDLRHHHGEQGIGSDIERHSEKRVTAPLLQLT